MGVNLRDIISHKELSLSDLNGKTIAIDALNNLYQFLAGIRGPDGSPLMDSDGNVTSHLTGLLYRTTKLLGVGVNQIYVFDGKAPDLKQAEINRRREIKVHAESEYKKAVAEERLDDARKYASRTSRFTTEMLDESKKLLDLMGVPWIQAPSEGEAQCVHLVKKGDAWAVGSQDYDALLFGTPRLVKGLSLSGRFELEIVDLGEVLIELDLTREQLIDVAILIGTDFNDGVKGIGPKKGLKAVRENQMLEVTENADFNLDEVRDVFLNHPITDDYNIEVRNPDEKGLIEFLCDKHDFSQQRVKKTVNDINTARKNLSQKDLSKWF